MSFSTSLLMSLYLFHIVLICLFGVIIPSSEIGSTELHGVPRLI